MEKTDLNLLMTFMDVYRQGSYTLAAQELGISQAAVSQQIRRLEDQLGKKLFVRQGRSIAPTAHAMFMADKLEQADSLIHQAVSERSFKVYCQEMFVFQLNHLDLEMQPSPLSEAELLDDLRKHRVDLVLDHTTVQDGSLIREELVSEDIVLTASVNHPRLKGEITEEQFFQERQVAFAAIRQGGDMYTTLADDPKPRKVVYKTSSLMTMLTYISTSDKIGFTPARLFRIFGKGLQLQQLTLPIKLKNIPCFMIYHRRDRDDPVHREKREMIKALLQRPVSPEQMFCYHSDGPPET